MAVVVRRMKRNAWRQRPHFRKDWIDPLPRVEAEKRQPDFAPCRNSLNATFAIEHATGALEPWCGWGDAKKARSHVDERRHEEASFVEGMEAPNTGVVLRRAEVGDDPLTAFQRDLQPDHVGGHRVLRGKHRTPNALSLPTSVGALHPNECLRSPRERGSLDSWLRSKGVRSHASSHALPRSGGLPTG